MRDSDMIKSVLLDLDDTIFDFHRAEAAALTGMLTELEITPTEEVISLYSEINDRHWKMLELGTLTRDELLTFATLLCPFAPHLCEEINEILGGKSLLSLAKWPAYDEAKTVDASIEVAVQINGKVRATVVLPLNCPKDEAIALAKADERIAAAIEGKTVIKEIAVPNKIVNIVVK